MTLRFHWMLPQAGEGRCATAAESARYRVGQTRHGSGAATPDLQDWVQFAQTAERAGLESVLISISRHEPDPLVIATALGCSTEKLKFIIAYRSGLILPTTFVQQLNTVSAFLGGRIAFNVVAGSSMPEQLAYGDPVPHDERYERAAEFLTVCRKLWAHGTDPEPGIDFEGKHYRVQNGFFPTPFVSDRGGGPEVYVSGHSPSAESLALSHASCWLRGAQPPGKIAGLVARAREQGVEVGLRLCIMCRPTREEAVQVVESIRPHCDIGMWDEQGDVRNDSTMYRQARDYPDWVSDNLWAGLVPLCGPVWTTLLGSPQEIADALLAYRKIGITQFIFSSWPEQSEVERFGREVIPLVRRAEAELEV